MEFTESTILDANGTTYRVGWDEHGWFTIQHVKLHHVDDAIDAKDAETIEHEGEEYCYDSVGKYPNTSFPPEVARQLVGLIEEK